MEFQRKVFFSKENIHRIQKKIKNKIYEKTDGKVILTVDQDELDLLIIMNNIFNKIPLDEFNSLEPIRQIKRLNRIVIKSIVPEMIINIKQSSGYSNTIDKTSQPLPLPINANRAGKKTLPSVTTTF
jgi:hypothetical protein